MPYPGDRAQTRALWRPPRQADARWLPGGVRERNIPTPNLHILAQVHFRLDRFEEAESLLKRRIIREPDIDISRVLLASIYGYLGRHDEARIHWADTFAINPDFSLEQRRRVLPYCDPADLQRVVDGLRKVGIAV